MQTFIAQETLIYARADNMDSRKITAALAIAALMTLAVVTAGCTTTSPSPTPTPIVQTTTQAGNNTTLTSAAGFKITFPSKYKYDQNGSTPAKLYVYLDPTDVRTGVVIGTQSIQSNASLDSYVSNYENDLLKYQNFTPRTNTTSMTLGGKPAKTLTFTAIVPVQYEVVQTKQTGFKNETLQIQEIWAINNGTAFTVTYKAPPSNFTKYLPEAQNIVSTFQFI